MSRTDAQNKRLNKEEQIVSEYFPNKVKWISRNGNDTKVEIKMTTNSNKSYTLRVCIPQDYPNSCPDLLVSNPARPLKDASGNEMQCGTDNHSYGTKDGLTTICHFVPHLWTNEYTLYQVFMKGRIWLEAYEIHLRTGKPIKTYLREMPSNLPIEELLSAAIFQRILENFGEHQQERSTVTPEQPPQSQLTADYEEEKPKSGCLVM